MTAKARACVIICSLALWATSAHAEPGRDAPTIDFRGDEWYVDLAPGLVQVRLLHPEGVLYTWGLGGGHRDVWPTGFTLTEGLSFEHSVGAAGPAQVHVLRLGADLRIGWSGRRIFIYAPFGASLDVVRGVHRDGDLAVSTTAVGKGVRAGMGLLGKLSQRVALGAEFDASVSAAKEYFDVFGTVRLLVQIGF